jgi:hypothetical protein
MLGPERQHSMLAWPDPFPIRVVLDLGSDDLLARYTCQHKHFSGRSRLWMLHCGDLSFRPHVTPQGQTQHVNTEGPEVCQFLIAYRWWNI